VPQSIVRKELLPTVRRNNSYLSANQYELLANDQTISPDAVDFGDIDFSQFPYRVRQKPGSRNALGAVKFLFPNPSSIYLHDSPAKSLFARSDRALSHGCIRLEYPDLLAQALLEKDTEWTESRISSTITRGERHQVNLDETVPVYLAYFTVRVLESGDVAFFDDIYGLDSARLRM
jgi:murein L,D-transpeptidase YcbB/YkuD